MFTGLKERVLCGVDFLVSDAHKGMVNALTDALEVLELPDKCRPAAPDDQHA